jgi:hypothetical protein
VTLVVFHTSVLYQVPPQRRTAFLALVRTLPGHWISVEEPDLVPLDGIPATAGDRRQNVVALDGRPLAWARGHGQAVTWFG